MKILKKILLVIVSLIVLLLIVAIFIPHDYAVTRTGEIHRPQPEVFNYLKSLKNQEQYSYWVMKDPKIQLNYTGQDGTVGSSVSWKSEEMGEGSQTIAAIEGNRIDVDLHFIKPMEGSPKAHMTAESIDANTTKVVFEFNGHEDYPFNLMSIIGKKFIGDAYDQNLAQLRKNLEK